MTASAENDAASELRRWFVAETGSERIRFTAAGRQALQADLAKVGIDIRTIRTRQQARQALAALERLRMAELESFMGQDPRLDAVLRPLFTRR